MNKAFLTLCTLVGSLACVDFLVSDEVGHFAETLPAVSAGICGHAYYNSKMISH